MGDMRAESLLYEAIKELDYVRSVENCNSGLCASPRGEEIIEAGMVLLGVKRLSEDTLEKERRLEYPEVAR